MGRRNGRTLGPARRLRRGAPRRVRLCLRRPSARRPGRPDRQGRRLPALRRGPAGGDRPPGRVPLGAVLDDRRGPRDLGSAQQHRGHDERALRDARPGARGAPGQARHDGRVRHAEPGHPRGLLRGRVSRPPRPPALPPAGRLLVPLEQGPRQQQRDVRLPHLRAPGDRRDAGRRLRHPLLRQHRRPSGRPRAPHPSRLRPGLRHGAQPLLLPVRDRRAADPVRPRQPASRLPADLRFDAVS